MLHLIRLKSVDFVLAMTRLVQRNEYLKETKKMGVNPSAKVIACIETLGSHVSIKTFEMLKIICEKYHLDRFLMYYVTENPELSPEELVDQIKVIDANAFYDLYIKNVIKPEYDSESAIKDKIDENYANNTMPMVMRYVQLKKFKTDAPVIFELFIQTLEEFLSAYLHIEAEVNAYCEMESLNYLEVMKDQEDFKSKFLMIDLNEVMEKIERIDVSISIMGEFSLSYNISKDYRVLSMIIGFGMRQLVRPHDEDFELEVFKCLGDATKLKMIQLAAKEPLCAKDFTDRLELSKATISHHINVLISLRIFRLNLQEGKKLYYVTDKVMLNRFWDQFNQRL